MEQTEAWERQSYETPKAWEAFKVYRDLGQSRSLMGVRQFLGRPESDQRTFERWSSKNNWVERCRKYDTHCDRINRQALREAEKQRYLLKVAEHKESKERLGRALTHIGARILTVLQEQIAARAREQAPLTGGEIAALFRVTIAAFQVGLGLIDEVLQIELQEQSVTGVEVDEELTADNAEDLVKEYFKLIEGLSI